MIQNIRYQLEALALKGLFCFLRALPLDAASALGGWLAQLVGPRLNAHRTAIKNIERFLPELSTEGQKELLKSMWDHFGRVAAELSQLANEEITRRIAFHGMENMPAPNTPVLFFSGHIGNWELLPCVSRTRKVPVTLVYRKANNPFVDKLIADIRAYWAGNMFAKGPTGAVKMARAIKNREAIAMLVDQKMNDGIAVPFFGVDAMTAPAIAQLALRYDLPIIPAKVIRKNGAHFDATIYPPLPISKTGDTEKDTLAIMTAINQLLEGWIRENPAQWFWVHQRWPKK